jgi:1-phosphatidylinositol-3-phosphate 5-kinase
MSMMNLKKSPQIASTQNLPVTPQLLAPNSPMIDEFCSVKSPILIDRIS